MAAAARNLFVKIAPRGGLLSAARQRAFSHNANTRLTPLSSSRGQTVNTANKIWKSQTCCLSTSSYLSSARVQHPAPSFKSKAVVNGDFKTIRLEDYRGQYLVLFFYPLDFTFVCPTEIIAFSERASEFSELNTAVVGVSVDSHFSHLAWINTPRKEGGLGPMNIPLLSDFTKTISKDYGVLLEEEGIALRGLFLIDPDGVVCHMSVNDLPVGRSVDETLRLVRAFQFVAKHGEVCPAGWTPDSPTIKPDPKGSKLYFETVNK